MYFLGWGERPALLGHTCCTVLAECSAVQCSALHCTAIVQCSTVHCSEVQCSAVLYSAVPFITERCTAMQSGEQEECWNVKITFTGAALLSCNTVLQQLQLIASKKNIYRLAECFLQKILVGGIISLYHHFIDT